MKYNMILKVSEKIFKFLKDKEKDFVIVFGKNGDYGLVRLEDAQVFSFNPRGKKMELKDTGFTSLSKDFFINYFDEIVEIVNKDKDKNKRNKDKEKKEKIKTESSKTLSLF